MDQRKEQAIELIKTGIGIQKVAEHTGLKRHQVEYLKRKEGIQGKYRKQPYRRTVLPTQLEIIQDYGYLSFETTERNTIICTIDDTSGDECKGIKNAIRSAYEKITRA